LYGKKGAVEAREWISQTESVLDISNCADEYKVGFSVQLFKEEALKWWKIVLHTKGKDTASKLT
jgi:hypothetical protein